MRLVLYIKPGDMYMPSFPDFSELEYRARLQKAQSLIDEHRLDALFMTQAEHVYYMTGLNLASMWVAKDRPFAVIVKDGSTTIITAETMIKHARETSWADDIVTYPRGDVACSTMVKAFETHGLKGARIGAELSYGVRMGMPVEDFDMLRKKVNGEFVDASQIFWRMRMIKTKLEADRMKKAAQITSCAMEKAFASFKEGMTERELASKVGAFMMDEGADFPSFITLSSGERFGYPNAATRMGGIFPLDIKIRRGDYIQLDCAATYRYYGADVCRLALVGTQPTQDMRDLYQIYKECSDKGIQAMKPGAKAEDVYKTVKRVIDESCMGLTVRSERFGHGVGLEPHEPPNLAKGVKIALEPGMVLSMEPWGICNANGQELNCEDNVLITDIGSERITTLHKDLRII